MYYVGTHLLLEVKLQLGELYYQYHWKKNIYPSYFCQTLLFLEHKELAHTTALKVRNEQNTNMSAELVAAAKNKKLQGSCYLIITLDCNWSLWVMHLYSIMSTLVQEDPCAFVPDVGQLSSSLPLVGSGWMTITFPKTSSTFTGLMYFKHRW